jgi:lipopolysaccharide/colanic/teichoic acid biosynthesis glycosyltransferase
MQSMIWRAIELVIVATSAVMVAPLMLLAALFIVLDSPGPVFMKSTRVGKDGKLFTMYKFRTMRFNLDDKAHIAFVRRLVEGQLGSERGEPARKLRFDPRITPFGRFLRKISLDELPQILNVLKGDMSLVGPRPALPFEVEVYKEWQMERLKVKPGITGLYQIRFGERPVWAFDDMVKLDIEYVRAKSLWLDLKLLFLTPIAVVEGDWIST